MSMFRIDSPFTALLHSTLPYHGSPSLTNPALPCPKLPYSMNVLLVIRSDTSLRNPINNTLPRLPNHTNNHHQLYITKPIPYLLL